VAAIEAAFVHCFCRALEIRSMNQARLLFALAAILLTVTSPAMAQRGGTGGMNSMMGMSGGGMTGMNGMSGFSGGSGLGMGGMNSGMGGMGGGMSGGMGGFGTGLGGSGMGFGQSGMNNMQGGQQGFIGRDSSEMSAIFQQMGRSSNQFLQQLNRTMGRGRGGGRNTSQEENAALAVRVRLDVAFDQPQVQPAIVANKVRTRLASTLTKRNVMAPEVEVADDTVVLRGVAKSESQRMVIEQLVRMEPGVFAVDNQMTVAANPSESLPSAPQPSN
jgi:hypothetical protein